MHRRWLLLFVGLMVLGGGVAAAQETPAPETRIELPAEVVEVRYGDEIFELNPEDSTLGIGYVDEVRDTAEGVILIAPFFVHDETGWRSAGVLSGSAEGLLADAQRGDKLVLSVLDGGE